MIEGETVATGAPAKCADLGCPGASGPQVLHSGAGFYVGYFCNQCGPYSRESGYYATNEDATAALATEDFGRDTSFNPATLRVFTVTDSGQSSHRSKADG